MKKSIEIAKGAVVVLLMVAAALPIYPDNDRWVYAPDGEVSISPY